MLFIHLNSFGVSGNVLEILVVAMSYLEYNGTRRTLCQKINFKNLTEMSLHIGIISIHMNVQEKAASTHG